MKNIIAQIIVLSLIISLFSFGIVPNWYVYNSKKFTISFPQKPIEEAKRVTVKDRDIELKTLTYKALNVTEKNLKFDLLVNEIPVTGNYLTKDSEKTYLDGAVKAFIKKQNATTISDNEIKFYEYSGREIKMSINEGKIILNMKSYIIRNEYYALIVYSTKQNDDNSEIDLFFKSFDVHVLTAK